MNSKPITFITGNKGKLEEAKRILRIPVTHQNVDLQEIQSLSLSEIIEYKAREAYKVVEKPVLVEDTSLRFHALGRLPGPFIKWFLKELDNEGLCRLLDGFKDRSASAEVIYGYFDGETVLQFHAETKGIIATHPKGNKGFGWDPVFIPKGFDKTWAQMTTKEKDAISMRRIALQKLEKFLQSNN